MSNYTEISVSLNKNRAIYLIIAGILALCVWLMNPLKVRAAGEDVNISSASATTSSVTVSGTTDASSVMVQVRDADGNVLDMYSMGVLNGEFSGSFNVNLTSGQDVEIYVADYEGGPFARQSTTATAPAQNPSSGSGNSSSGSSGQGGSDSGDGSSSGGSGATKLTTVKMEYIVVRGDTMTKIAWKLGVSLSSLRSWNTYIKNINLIFPGQKIAYYVEKEVPTDGNENAGNDNTGNQTRSRRYYVVQKGDNLYRIARRLGTTLRELLILNPLKNPNLIFPGQRIYY